MMKYKAFFDSINSQLIGLDVKEAFHSIGKSIFFEFGNFIESIFRKIILKNMIGQYGLT